MLQLSYSVVRAAPLLSTVNAALTMHAKQGHAMAVDEFNTQENIPQSDIPKNVKNLLGLRFNLLVVKAFSNTQNHQALWLCVCDCGNEKVVLGHSLQRGTTKSCGCLQPSQYNSARIAASTRPTKKCTICHSELPNTNDYFVKAKRGTLSSACKACHTDHNRLYRERNQEEVRARKRAEILDHPERIRERRQRYKAKHPDNIKERSKRYYWDNREKLLAYDKEYLYANYERELRKRNAYAKAHPEYGRAKSSRYRARKANAPVNDLTIAQWFEIQEAYKYRCVYCPENCWRCRQKKHKLTQDHIVPLSKGGSHTFTNVVPACQACNSKKSAGPPKKPVQPLLLTVAPTKKAIRAKDGTE